MNVKMLFEVDWYCVISGVCFFRYVSKNVVINLNVKWIILFKWFWMVVSDYNRFCKFDIELFLI